MSSVYQLSVPLTDTEWRKSRDGQSMTVAGHAAVFDRISHDLGGFREKVDRHAFDAVLDSDPDVHFLWDHDTRFVLARTRNKTLDLRLDPQGLHYWARVAPTSYAKDLEILMERGDIDQASFAFTVEEDDWEMDEEDYPLRTIKRVGNLFDVTVTAKGAYPQTDSSLRSLLQDAIAEGRLPNISVGRALDLAAPETVAEGETEFPQVTNVWISDGNSTVDWGNSTTTSTSFDFTRAVSLANPEETLAAAEDPPAEEPQEPDLLDELKARSRAAAISERESVLRLLRDNGLN